MNTADPKTYLDVKSLVSRIVAYGGYGYLVQTGLQLLLCHLPTISTTCITVSQAVINALFTIFTVVNPVWIVPVLGGGSILVTAIAAESTIFGCKKIARLVFKMEPTEQTYEAKD